MQSTKSPAVVEQLNPEAALKGTVEPLEDLEPGNAPAPAATGGAMTSENVQEQITNEATLHRYCRRCGRKLRNPDAMKLGYGRICARKRS